MMSQYLKRGFSNTAIYTLGSVIMRGISFLFLPYFLAKLSLEEMGSWDFYQTFFSLSVLLLSSCAATSMFRFYFAYKDQEPEKARAVIGNALFATGLLSAAITGIVVLIYCMHTLHPFTLMTGINSILFACFSLCIAYLRMKEMLVWYLVVFCSQSLLSLGGTVIAVSYGYGISSFFYATTASLILYIPFFITIWRHHATYSWPLAREQLAYSGPLLFYNLIYAGFFSIDRLMIASYGSMELLGVYGLLWRFGAIFQMFSVALVDAVQLVACDAYEKINTKELQLITSTALISLAAASLGAQSIAHYGVRLFFPSQHQGLTTYLPYFFLGLTMLEGARFLNIGFMVSKKTTATPWISAACICLEGIALYYGIPYGIIGICGAITGAFLCYAIVNYYVLNYLTINAFNPRSLILISSISITVAVCNSIFMTHDCIKIGIAFFGIAMMIITNYSPTQLIHGLLFYRKRTRSI